MSDSCRLRSRSKETVGSQTREDDPSKSTAQNWRNRMKAKNPQRYQQLLRLNKTSCKLYRLEMAMAEDEKRQRNLSEEEKNRVELLLERKRKYNAGARERMRKMRARRKAEKQSKKQERRKPQTRQDMEKHEIEKAKWRKAKQEKRDQLTAAERKRINKKRRNAYRLKNRQKQLRSVNAEELKEVERKLAEEEARIREAQENLQRQQQELQRARDELQEAGEDTRSGAARRKSFQRARQAMPQTPSQYVTTVMDLINRSTPRKAARLKQANVCTERDRAFSAAVMNVVASGLSKSKSSTTRRDLASSLNSLKVKNLQRRAAREFKVSRKLLSKAKRFKSGRKPLSTATVKLVENFFVKNSNEVPEKKLVSKRSGKAAAIITMPISKLHKEFCKSHPHAKIGFAKFASLRPRHIRLMNEAKFVGCVCEYCANIDLKLRSINAHLAAKKTVPIKNMYELSNMTMCEKGEDEKFHQLSCIKRECMNCGVSKLDAKLAVLRDIETAVSWKRWELIEQSVKGETAKTVKKRALLSKSGSMEELLTELIEEVRPFSEHLFTKDWQNDQLQLLRSNLPKDSALCILDFAENYVCRHQEEAQAAYWTHESATVHPVVTYYRCSQCPEIVTESIIAVSDDLTHDYHAVHKFQAVANHHLLKTRGLHLEKIYRFSDGCGSQYKSKGPISDISYALSDFGVTYHHNYSGTRHGKGASDGESAVLKSNATTAVKAGTALIRNARELYEYGKQNLTKNPEENSCRHHLRTLFFVSSEDINRERNQRYQKQVQGTRKLHAISTVRDGVVVTRNLSCFCDQCLQNNADGLCKNRLYVQDWKEVKLYRKSDICGDFSRNDPGQDIAEQCGDTSHHMQSDDGAGNEEKNRDDKNGGIVRQDEGSSKLGTGSYAGIKFTEKNCIFLALVNNATNDLVHVTFLKRRKSGMYDFTQERHCHPVSDVCGVLSPPMMVQEQRAFVYSFLPQDIAGIINRNPSATLK